MKPFNVYTMAAALLLSLPSIAQKSNITENQSQFKRLHLGDTVPMEKITLDNVRNYPGEKVKLSDFKGKYIILDFWNKGCSACIAAFPEMEHLQNQFKDDIQVLLVTYDSEEDLALLSKNSSNLRNTKLPVVIGEQVLTKQLFPSSSFPYHVWLDRSGKVVASTWMQETNAQNLRDLITGKSMDHIMLRNNVFINDLTDSYTKRIYDQFRNPQQSLLTIDDGKYLNLLKYYTAFPTIKKANQTPESVSHAFANANMKKGTLFPYYSMFMIYNMDAEQLTIRGHNIGNELKDSSDKTVGLRIINVGIDNLYKFAFYDGGKTRLIDNDFKKIVLEGKAKLLYEDRTDSSNGKRYLINNSYSYESRLPEYTLENAKKLLQLDLARFFGMTGIVEMRQIKHLIFIRLGTDEEKNIWAKDQTVIPDNGVTKKENDGWVFKGRNLLTYIFSKIRNANRNTEDPILIDETNFTPAERGKNINVLLKLKSLRATPENIPIIKKELARYGLGLKEEMRTVKVLVLTAAL